VSKFWHQGKLKFSFIAGIFCKRRGEAFSPLRGSRASVEIAGEKILYAYLAHPHCYTV
jgi:hypothetical protein